MAYLSVGSRLRLWSELVSLFRFLFRGNEEGTFFVTALSSAALESQYRTQDGAMGAFFILISLCPTLPTSC